VRLTRAGKIYMKFSYFLVMRLLRRVAPRNDRKGHCEALAAAIPTAKQEIASSRRSCNDGERKSLSLKSIKLLDKT